MINKKITMNYKKICFFLILFLSILFLENLQIYKKIFVLLSKDADKRMVDHHGYCDGESVGFIKYLYKKYNFKLTPKIVNFDEMVPDDYWSIFKFDKNVRNKIYNYNYIILLNYRSKQLNKIDNIIYSEVNNEFDLNNYKILEKSKNCFLLKLI